MYPDAPTVQRLALDLNSLLKGLVLKDLFSTSKYDVFFVFSNQIGIRLTFFQGIGLFRFPSVKNFPTTNRKAQFNAVHGQQLLAVRTHPGSRSFEMQFGNGNVLVFKLFGKFSNLIGYDFQNHQQQVFLPNFLKDSVKPYHTFINETSPEPMQVQKGSAMVYILNPTGNSFELSTEAQGTVHSVYSDMPSAINAFSDLYISSESFKERKKKHLELIEHRIRQKRKLLHQLQTALELLTSRKSYLETGHLIMANLHLLNTGMKEASLKDMYQDRWIPIKLKPELTPQQNAAWYYKKSKNEYREIEFRKNSIESLKHELARLEEKHRILLDLNHTKALREFEKQKQDTKSEASAASLPYLTCILEGFEIRIGKNARHNERLISEYASKNDLWLHVRDYSGSHVLIKNISNRKIPAPVIEAAASMAAYYSKARNHDWVTVIFTQRKYIRKPKGEDPGKVRVEKESSLLVKPSDSWLKALG